MDFTDQTDPSVIKHNPQPQLRSILIAFGYLISFTLLDLITNQFESLPGIVTWYPPAGLTYALLLVFGVRFTPAVTIALFLSSVFIYRIPQPTFVLFLWSFVVSFIYSAAAWFLRHRIHLDWQLRKLRDVAWLVFTVVLVSAFLAILTVSSSALGSAMPSNEILRAIFHWWIGEAVGVLTVTPFLLIFVMPLLKRFVDGKPERFSSAHRSFPFSMLASIGQAASLLIVPYWVFGIDLLDDYHPEFLIILPVIWIALTRGLKGTTAAILILNFWVVLAQWYFRFDLMRLGEMELLMIVICMVGLLMGAVVTERKGSEHASRESEERYRDLVENSQELICTHDLEGRILSTNPAGAKMLGLEMDALLKMNIRDFLTPDGQADFESYITSIKNDGKSSGLMLVQTSSGEKRLWEYNNTLRKEGVAAPIVRGMARDITASKRAEEEIIKQLDELQRWQTATLGRENRILELKHEVNELLAETNQVPRYPSAESPGEQE